MSQIASLIIAYLMIGVFVWIGIPLIEGAPVTRPKFFKCVIAWGPAALLGKKNTAKDWLWAEHFDDEDTGFDLAGMVSGEDDEGIENGDNNGV